MSHDIKTLAYAEMLNEVDANLEADEDPTFSIDRKPRLLGHNGSNVDLEYSQSGNFPAGARHSNAASNKFAYEMEN